MKHFDQTLLYTKEHMESKHLTLTKVAAKVNLADLLTKFVPSTQHKLLVRLFAMHQADVEELDQEQVKDEEGGGQSDDEHDAEIEQDN